MQPETWVCTGAVVVCTAMACWVHISVSRLVASNRELIELYRGRSIDACQPPKEEPNP